MQQRPNIVLILADDMGFSDISCYGGEVDTPALDRLAYGGVRMTQFYNTPRCSPSRASLLTGLSPHRVGVGILNNDDGPDGYPGNLSEGCVTLAEALKAAGYTTFMSGKWHLASNVDEPNGAWPTRRGFDRYFGSMENLSYYHSRKLLLDEQNIDHETTNENFFYTDAISDHAITFVEQHNRKRGQEPFFLYMAYTAPHWPLHAHDEDIAKYRGRFDKGWEKLREERLERLIDEGIIEPGSRLSDRDPNIPDWDSVEDREWEARRMEVYAAQIDRMDQGIGRVLTVLEQMGQLDNTIVIFLSDNGGCAEEFPPDLSEQLKKALSQPMLTRDGEPVVAGNRPGLMPGPESTFQSYGRSWANLSNTPFREYKHWVHEGGISTPFIIHWPAGLSTEGRLCKALAHITDVMATLLEATGASHLKQRNGMSVPPLEGRSLLPVLRGEADESDQERTLFWEHEGNCGVRRGRWKLVKKYGHAWELYDINSDRAEHENMAGQHPRLVAQLSVAYGEWASLCGVIPRETILEIYRQRLHAYRSPDASRSS